TSRYRRAPLRRNTFELRPHDTTRRNRYRATSSGLSRRWPWNVQVTPNSVSMPMIRRCTSSRLLGARLSRRAAAPTIAVDSVGDVRQGRRMTEAAATEVAPSRLVAVSLDRFGGPTVALCAPFRVLINATQTVNAGLGTRITRRSNAGG